VRARVKTTSKAAEGTPLVYQRALRLSGQTLTFVAGLLRGHLKKIGSRWRKLPPGKIALIVLAVLRHDHRLADMAAGNGVAATTIHRWTREIITLLAARALAKVARQGGEVVLLDGTLIPARRRTGTANRKNYNGKHKKHGLLFLAAWLRTAGLGALADLGFTGLDPDPGDPVIITGWKSTQASKTTPAQRQANQALSAARAPVEHGFSDLKNWRILTRLRLSPANATTLLRSPARPHPPAHQPLTDDHDLRPPALRTSAGAAALRKAPFSPRDLATPLTALLANGIPDTPVLLGL
jgi:hypothetical protein